MERKPVPAVPVNDDPLLSAYETHHLALLKLCVLLTCRREDAEEVVQEAFVRALRKLPELPPEAVGPYLRTTAMNIWRNRLRRIRSELRARAWTAGPTQRPDSEDHDVVWEAVKRLPARRRACVVLRYYEDLPEREVARILDCSVWTVKSQTSRALARLRKELGDGPGG